MSTITELEEKVKELMDEIETLKKQEKIEEFEYNFEEFESYFTIGSGGEVYQAMWTNHDLDFERYSQGNVFKTKEEAERERDKRILLTKLRQFRDKCNGDWEPDFDKDSFKYNLSLSHKTNVLKIHFSCNLEDFNLFGYFRKESDARRAIQLFGDEIIRLWVEE